MESRASRSSPAVRRVPVARRLAAMLVVAVTACPAAPPGRTGPVPPPPPADDAVPVPEPDAGGTADAVPVPEPDAGAAVDAVMTVPTVPDAPIEGDELPPTADTSLADAIVADWGGLLELAHAVYLARSTIRTDAEGYNSVCAEPIRVVDGPDEPPDRICTSVADVVGSPGPGSASPGLGDLAWVVTRKQGRREVILVAVADGCGGEGCADPPREALVQDLRCGQLDRLWADLPREHVRCRGDDDCVELTAMCFDAAVNASSAPAYREVLRRFGGVCLSPLAGACAPSRMHAECRGGRCVAAR